MRRGLDIAVPHLEAYLSTAEEKPMSAHALYVSAAYLISAMVIAGLIGWIWADQRARLRELAELDAAGARRRSGRAST